MKKEATAAAAIAAPAKSTNIPHYETIVGLRSSDINQIARRHIEVSKQIKELEAEKSLLRDKAVTIFLRAKVKSVILQDDVKATQFTHKSTVISGTKLFELGVSQKKIDAAKSTTPTETVKFTLPGEKEDGES